MTVRLLTCTCNGTVAVDGPKLSSHLSAAGVDAEVVMAGSQLCRRELVGAAKWLKGVDDIVVTCTQERPLFAEAGHEAIAPIKFVNIREVAGWGQEGAAAQPKIAALVAMAARDVREPVAAVAYRSSGRILLIGDAGALAWAGRLASMSSAPLAVSVLLSPDTGRSTGPLDPVRAFPVFSGEVESVSGWLGNFEVAWRQTNPIDLDACVRCGACLSACPEQAIDQSFQVDVSRCTGHRSCVAACGDIGAIDFTRRDALRREHFDLVIDFRREPAFRQHQLPQGYWHPSSDPARQVTAVFAAAEMVGEFEKPKFFDYRQSLCAHQRNGIIGCRQCIDVCSASAISSAGDGVRVEPHLCVGCGACATACPSGAMSYRYPDAAAVGTRARAALAAYRAAGGRRPVILLHDEEHAGGILARLGRGAGASVARAPVVRGLPARVIPLSLHHVASAGVDLAMAFIAFGAAQVIWWFTGDEAPQYRELLKRELDWAGTLLAGLGLGGERLQVVDADSPERLEAALCLLQTPAEVSRPATFSVSPDKRRTIGFAVDHLLAATGTGGLEEAPAAAVALPAGSPFGRIRVDEKSCTLCLACVGACPEKALLDMGDEPGLRLIEGNCVQCRLCEQTCPEDAIAMEPRYLPGTAAQRSVVLNAASPLACIRCGKHFGTQQMIGAMKRKLAGHSMFDAGRMKTLEMCADCRVSEMITANGEVSILDIPRVDR